MRFEIAISVVCEAEHRAADRSLVDRVVAAAHETEHVDGLAAQRAAALAEGGGDGA